MQIELTGNNNHAMGVSANMFKRSMVAGIALGLASALSACAGGATQNTPNASSQPTSPETDGPGIDDPRDASKAAICDLLPPQAASSLGLDPQGEEKEDPIDPDAPRNCDWSAPDGAPSVIFTVLPGRSVQDYTSHSGDYVDFAELTVAGHPAVRANQNDPMSGGSCDIFVESKDGQIVYSYSRLPAEQTGKVDPCELAQKALEAAVPTWPSVE